MTWLIMSLLTALITATQDAYTKKYFSGLTPYNMAGILAAYSLPFYLIAFPFILIPPIDRTFLGCLILGLPLDALGFLLYMKAIRVSPLSLTLPYLAFTPAFMILTGYLLLDEIPNQWGMIGIGVLCIGAYTLNIQPGKQSVSDPIQAIFRETGSWLMLLVSFIYSMTAVIGKKAILHSSPMFFAISYCLVFNALLIVFLRIFKKIDAALFDYPGNGMVVGVLGVVHVIFHTWAISLTKAAYMISIKRLSVVFGMIYGRVWFNETNMIFRFSGAILMIIGTVIISLQGM